MIKFKEHEGKLFRMLENPVQLKEKDTNVLVQFITHGAIGEYVMEHWLDCNQENVPIFVDSVDSDGDVTVCIENGNEHCCCPFPMFEIIGTIVKEGSDEWALYQMMQGLKVCNPQLAKDKAARFECCDDETFNTYWYIVSDTVVEGKSNYATLSVSSWLFAASFTGWQIYKEPETPQYKVGDWVEFIDAGGRKSQGKYLSNAYDNTILVLDITYNLRCVVPVTKIIRKFSPSEVKVPISIEGKIRPGCNESCFEIFTPNGGWMEIGKEQISKDELELVESLLKAQEEK